MITILKVSRFQMSLIMRIGFPIYIIYTLIYLGNMYYIKRMEYSTLEFITMLIVFLIGVICFKVSFKLMQLFNVSRKKYFLGTLITFLITCLLIAIFNLIIEIIIVFLMQYGGLYEHIYHNSFLFTKLLWLFSSNIMAITSGFFFSSLYYRLHLVVKILVTLVIIYTIFSSLIMLFVTYINMSSGISINPYTVSLIFLFIFSLFASMSYLVLRRTAIHD